METPFDWYHHDEWVDHTKVIDQLAFFYCLPCWSVFHSGRNVLFAKCHGCGTLLPALDQSLLKYEFLYSFFCCYICGNHWSTKGTSEQEFSTCDVCAEHSVRTMVSRRFIGCKFQQPQWQAAGPECSRIAAAKRASVKHFLACNFDDFEDLLVWFVTTHPWNAVKTVRLVIPRYLPDISRLSSRPMSPNDIRIMGIVFNLQRRLQFAKTVANMRMATPSALMDAESTVAAPSPLAPEKYNDPDWCHFCAREIGAVNMVDRACGTGTEVHYYLGCPEGTQCFAVNQLCSLCS